MRSVLVVALYTIAVSLSMAQQCGPDNAHPVVLIPGLMGSVLRTDLNIPPDVPLPWTICKRKDTDRCLWIKGVEFIPFLEDCLFRYLSLDWNNNTGRFEPLEGTNIAPPDFGGVGGIEYLDPEDDLITELTGYYHGAIAELQENGGVVGKTIFGAPFDWRFMPYDSWVKQTKELVERAFFATGRKVIVVGHSLGGPYSYTMLMSQPLKWRQKFVERWIQVAPAWRGIPLAVYALLTQTPFGLPGYFGSIFKAARSIESLWFLLPGEDYPETVVTTDKKDYNWENLHEILERVGLPHAKAAIDYTHALLPKFKWEHPGINTTVVYSVGEKTIESATYYFDWDIGKVPPHPEMGDGDSQVPTKSLSFTYDKWAADPKTAPLVERQILTDTSHIPILWDEEFLETLVRYACPAR